MHKLTIDNCIYTEYYRKRCVKYRYNKEKVIEYHEI